MEVHSCRGPGRDCRPHAGRLERSAFQTAPVGLTGKGPNFALDELPAPEVRCSPLPTLQTDELAITYEDSGSGERGTAVLLHGWPDDASTWTAVAPALNRAGLRTIVPTLRGFGGTRFLTAAAPRTGNSGILAMDVIALVDGLGIGRFAVAGHDWGSNVAEALAVGWPGRVERLAMLSTPPRLGGMPTPPFWHAQLEWYRWFMVTPRGAQAVQDDRRGFARLHWENWSPPADSTRRPSTGSRAPSTIRIGSMSRCTATVRAGTWRRPTRAAPRWRAR